MVKVRRLGIALALVVFLGFAGSASAAVWSSKGIWASCARSAYTDIAGSGHAYIYFIDAWGGTINSQFRDLGGGSTAHVATGIPGSYDHVELYTPNNSGYIFRAGCGY